jgi:DNA-binding transcriptional MerR regulator
MPHKIAKLLLEHADTFLDRTEAVKTALRLGMPLDEIQEYLDWLDAVRPPQANDEDTMLTRQAADRSNASTNMKAG